MTDPYRTETPSDEPERPPPEWIGGSAGPSADRPEARPGTLSLPRAPAELERAWSFHQTLHVLTPRAWVAQALVFLNLLVFALMVVNGVHILTPQSADLVHWGANVGILVSRGAWWRLVTCMFIHIGIFHVACNMWALWVVGPLVERLVGNLGFAVLYLVSGMVGSLASAWWKAEVVSAGASGAVFGVSGMLLCVVVIRHESIPRPVLHALRNAVLTFLGFNLLYGWSREGIDMAAHLGGLAGGFACGLVLGQPVSLGSRAGRGWRNLAAATVGLAGVAGGAWLMHGRFDYVGEVVGAFGKAEREVLDSFNQAVDQVRAQRVSDDELVQLLERELIPQWRAARAPLAQLLKTPGARKDVIAELMRYAELREQGWQTMVRAIRQKDPKLLEVANAKQREADQVLAQSKLKK
jgi:rhomboid protease GluP